MWLTQLTSHHNVVSKSITHSLLSQCIENMKTNRILWSLLVRLDEEESNNLGWSFCKLWVALATLSSAFSHPHQYWNDTLFMHEMRLIWEALFVFHKLWVAPCFTSRRIIYEWPAPLLYTCLDKNFLSVLLLSLFTIYTHRVEINHDLHPFPCICIQFGFCHVLAFGLTDSSCTFTRLVS